MFLVIITKDKIIKQEFINEYKYKGIQISVSEGIIRLDDGYTFFDGTVIKNLTLTSYLVYHQNDEIKLYFYDIEKGAFDYKLYEIQDLYIANDLEANVISKDNYLDGYYLKLVGNHLDTNFDDLFVNHIRRKNHDLESGDFIEFLGLSFFFYNDFIYLNSFLVDSHLKEKEIREVIVNNKNKPIDLINYYEVPKNGLKIEKIKEFDAPRKNSSRKLILQIGPTITMSLAMILMASISIYNSYINSGTILNIISLLIMPLTMLVSGILWPVLSTSSDSFNYKKEYNKAKSAYIAYLKEYENKVENDIRDYVNEEKRYLFNSEDINSKLFYINHDSSEFLKITLGYENKKLDYNIRLTNDKEIDEHLNRIKYHISHIENCPLYLDLKENKRVSIIVKERKLNYYLNKYLLELISKYHFNDLNIAIYSKDSELMSNFFYLPHLMLNKTRLTLNNEREYQDLNNLKLDKPLVVFLTTNSDYIFTNPNIYTIFFSSDYKKILKSSNCIVEYNDNLKGIFTRKSRTMFSYYNEYINFNHYYKLLGVFSNSDDEYSYSFKDFYKDVDIARNYIDNWNGLKAEFATITNELMSFDLHESKDGPHGLIGGSTGSGKSELIVSMLLSLAIRYSPEYLSIILIDYKGGGIKDSLTFNTKTIPHIIADVNNLESDTFERLIVAIERECRRRERLFKELSLKASLSIMNIDDYLENKDEYGYEPIAHLLIVVDEFAELKKENPFVIKELISFSRIGRSLGLHLILATQKPSGIIDEEIWSNSHFKIALKVHSEKDSQDIIKLQDAAYLTQPGEFYLQVDSSTIKASSLYAKRDINGNDQYEVELLDNKLKTANKKIRKQNNIMLESSYYVNKILEATSTLNVPKLDFERPMSLTRNELIEKYGISNYLIFGEKDDYLNAKKDILKYAFNENMIIYSNRKYEINNIINTFNSYNKQMVIISNNKYEGGFIKDSLYYGDTEDIDYLFRKLTNDMDSELTLIIEDINTLFSYDEEYINKIYKLIRRSSISHFSFIIFTTQSNINFKLLNSIKTKLVIDAHDNQDVINVFSTKGIYKGKSFFFDELPITFEPIKLEQIKEMNKLAYSYLDLIPAHINYEHKNRLILIGYDIYTRKKVYIKDNEELLITSFDLDLLNSFRLLFKDNNNIKVLEYDDNLIKEHYLNILWIGSSITNQRLFYLDKDINENDGYLLKNNKGKEVRLVNYE